MTQATSLSSGMQRSTFRYRALRPEGGLERGQIQAPSPEAALAMLAGRGLFPVAVNLQSERRAVFAPRISARDVEIGFRILATLLDSGLSVRRAASVFASLAPSSWSSVIAVLLPALREGRSVSAALDEASVGIPPEMIGMLRAGEAGGTVPAALRAAADLAQSAATTRSAILGALAYPALLAITGAASVIVLVSIVLPRFATILADLNQALPPTTRFVLECAEVARRAGLSAGIGLLVTFALVRVCLRRPTAALVFQNAVLKIPLIGSLQHAASTARSCATLAALLESGLSVAPALEMTAAAAGNTAIADRILRARTSVIAGHGLGAALSESRAFTIASLRLVRAGDEAGRLPAMLAQAAQLERDRATDGVRRLVRLLEPTLILLFAGVVALVAAALMQAVYSVRPA